MRVNENAATNSRHPGRARLPRYASHDDDKNGVPVRFAAGISAPHAKPTRWPSISATHTCSSSVAASKSSNCQSLLSAYGQLILRARK